MKYRLLLVDLAKKTTVKKTLGDEYVRQWIGGRGIGAALLKESNAHRINTFSKDMPIIVSTSPFCGLLPCVNRTWIASYSPLTKFYCCSSGGGFFAHELRKSGFDGIKITGKCANPSYIYIEDEKVQILDGKEIWGKTTEETGRKLAEKHSHAQIMCIGPAGENMVSFASILLMPGEHCCGRGGLGAIFGDKKIKAVVIKGSKKIPGSDDKKMRELADAMSKDILEKDISWREKGTLELIEVCNEAGIFPTDNWKKSHFDDGKKIASDVFTGKVLRRYSCHGCPIGCTRVQHSNKYVNEGRGPEYESVWAFSAEINNADPEVVTAANRYCNLYGLDTLEMGSTIGWFKECIEKGIFNYKLKGPQDLLDLIVLISNRHGIGNLLANGPKKASETFGMGSEKFAIHQAGMTLPAYDPRGVTGMLLTYTFGPRHGCHLKAWSVGKELSMRLKDRLSLKGKAKMISEMLNQGAAHDAFSCCSFVNSITTERIQQAMNLLYKSKPDVVRIGRNIVDLERKLDVLRGLKKEEDILPYRILEETTEINGKKVKVKASEFNKAKREFYKIRKW